MRARIATAALALADVAVLIALRPPVELLAGLAHPHHWLATAGTDAATAQLAAGLLWVVAGWLAAGLLACGLAAMPGVPGAAARRAARVLLPRAIYRLAAGAAGIGIALTPLAATATTPVLPPGNSAPQWPTAVHGHPSAPGWPVARPVRGSHRSRHSSQQDPADQRRNTGHHPDRPTQPRPDPARVVVHPGESLWQIAAAQLDGRPSTRRVAAAWPRWYAANRHVIGRDPDLIHPGTVLRPPTEGSRS